MTDADLTHNEASTERLRDIVSGLSDDELGTDLGGGWTVSHALWHIAFWDARQSAALHCMELGEPFPTEDRATNLTLDATAAVIDPRAAAEAAEAAAVDLDAALVSLSAAQRESLRADGFGYVISRHAHRNEHADQIVRALNR